MSQETNAASQSLNNGNGKDENEITTWGRFWSGFLMIFLIFLSGVYLIGHWPDRLPNPKDNILALYHYEWFNVRLANIPDPGHATRSGSELNITETGNVDSSEIKKILASGSADTIDLQQAASTLPKTGKSDPVRKENPADCFDKQCKGLIHINTILLILVAVAGFLGNLIYVATSFTTYVGAGTFKRSWILWYCVKPFTASALAVAFYFVFRGGFLNMSDDSTNINLYGVMTLALLTGLFTDRATLKLKEVFEVLLHPKEDRPDQLGGGDPKISDVKSDPLETGKLILVTLNGKNLTQGSVDVSVEGRQIDGLARLPESMSFSYTLPEEFKGKDSVKLRVKFEKLPEANSFDLKVKPSGQAPTDTQTESSGPVDTSGNPDDIVPGGPDVAEGETNIVKE